MLPLEVYHAKTMPLSSGRTDHNKKSKNTYQKFQVSFTSSSSDSSSWSIEAAFDSGMTGVGWGALNFSAA